MYVHGRHVLIIDPATGHVLRDFILDPTRHYQPRSFDQPPDTKKHPGPKVRGVSDVLRHHTSGDGGI